MPIFEILKFLFGAMGTQQFGFIASQVVAGADNEALAQFREEMEAIADERRTPFFQALDDLVEATSTNAAGILADETAFFGGAGDRFAEVADPLRTDIESRTTAGIGGANAIARGFSSLEQRGGIQGANLLEAQRGRETRLLGELRGLGAAEQAEASRQFAVFGRREQDRLSALGLGGGSAAGSVAAGSQRLRTRELGLLNQQLRREQLGLSADLSGQTLELQDLLGERNLARSRDTLAARGSALSFATGLRGEEIEGLGALGFGQLGAEETAAMSLFAERERLGTAGEQALVDAEERKNRFEFDDIIRLPPGTSNTSGLGLSSGR